MLIEFKVGNFKSFKDPATFSMTAVNSIRSKNKSLDVNNIFAINKHYQLLKSASIYGANASGKSSLIQAMFALKTLVLNSVKDEDCIKKNIHKFRLDTIHPNFPTTFEITFLYSETIYRYGVRFTSDAVHSEWLYQKHNKSRSKETELFVRTSSTFNINFYKFREGKGLEDKTMDSALFLTVVKQFNGEIANKVTEFFKSHFILDMGIGDEFKQTETIAFAKQNPKHQKAVVNFLKFADLSIDNISFKEMPLADGSTQEIVFTHHKQFDNQGNYVDDTMFRLDLFESEGTRKLFSCSGLFIELLWRGGCLIIDELNARLHASITKQLIKLFHSPVSNPNNAQLIFATHDTNLLNNNLLRRDQIWFTEKDRYGATDLYSLVEFNNGKKVRNDASFEKDYLQGKYGAIPFLGDESFLFDD